MLHAPRQSARPQDGPAPVAFARERCQSALESGEVSLIQLAISFVERWAQDVLESEPANPELRLWHELLLDLAISIEDRMPRDAGELEALAGEVYAAVVHADRNPRDEIMWRPTARRVLRVIAELGDGCTQTDVRIRAGYGATHLSNIVTLLRGYGLIESAPDAIDGRIRRLSLTDDGRALVLLEEDFELPAPPSPSKLPRVEKAATAPADVYQPPMRVKAIDRRTGQTREATLETCSDGVFA